MIGLIWSDMVRLYLTIPLRLLLLECYTLLPCHFLLPYIIVSLLLPHIALVNPLLCPLTYLEVLSAFHLLNESTSKMTHSVTPLTPVLA